MTAPLEDRNKIPSPKDMEIRDQLARYLAGEISLQVFEEWFVSHSWDVNRTGNENAVELVYKIELRLAEFSKGHRTEQEFQNLLLPCWNIIHSA